MIPGVASLNELAGFFGFRAGFFRVVADVLKSFDVAIDVRHVDRVTGFGIHNVTNATDAARHNRQAGAGDFEEDIGQAVGLRRIEESVVASKVEAINAVISSLVSDCGRNISEKVARIGFLSAAISINEIFRRALVFGRIEFFDDLFEKVRAFLGADATSPENAKRLLWGGIVFFYGDNSVRVF